MLMDQRFVALRCALDLLRGGSLTPRGGMPRSWKAPIPTPPVAREFVHAGASHAKRTCTDDCQMVQSPRVFSPRTGGVCRSPTCCDAMHRTLYLMTVLNECILLLSQAGDIPNAGVVKHWFPLHRILVCPCGRSAAS